MASIGSMKLPCDEAVIRSAAGEAPCRRDARSWILAATILGSSMAFIDSTVVNVALPALQADFHSTLAGVQWVIESYGLFLSTLILVGGSLGDHFGRRRIFLLGVSIFALASAACGASLNLQELILARSVQGVGAALLVPGSLAIISASFDEASRGQAIGTWSGFTAITTAIGPVMGGYLVEYVSWRWVFFLNLPIAAAVVAISARRIPESRSSTAGHVDWFGALIGSIGMGGLVAGFIESANLGWGNPLVYGGLIAGLGCLLALSWMERRTASPMVPPALFASRSFSGANLLTLLLYAAVGVFFFLFPLNLIQVQGYSATATGSALLPFILLMFFLSRWSGGLVIDHGARGPLILGPLIAASGFLWFALSSGGSGYWKAFFPALVVLGLGMAVTVAPLTTVVMSSVDRDRVGTASGINNAVARVAGVLAIAVFGVLMVSAFRWRLDQGLSRLPLAANIVQEIRTNAVKLAGLRPPAGVDPSDAIAIQKLVGEAFGFGFRIVMLASAALCAGAAAVAGLTIPPDSSHWQREPGQDKSRIPAKRRVLKSNASSTQRD